jgi:putative hydrolase of the HAD superfamily
MKLADTVKTIVFDWGDTLMVDDPRQNTPMVDWPKVSAVPGSSETLAKLHGRYHLGLATSAELSTVEQIRAALARVGLNEFIDDVFTKNQLNGARKPEIGFYRGIAQKLNLQPDQLLMVGDHYRADILGASAAGWFTAWYNPMQKTAPQLNPLYDLDLTSLTELPAALQQPLLPNLTQCLDWTLIEGTSAALRSHVELVACVAYTLAAGCGLPVRALTRCWRIAAAFCTICAKCLQKGRGLIMARPPERSCWTKASRGLAEMPGRICFST